MVAPRRVRLAIRQDVHKRLYTERRRLDTLTGELLQVYVSTYLPTLDAAARPMWRERFESTKQEVTRLAQA
jgi:hypothetical protein